jgi:succinate dehydrogenase/fumarate reductase flavoprotein subunit
VSDSPSDRLPAEDDAAFDVIVCGAGMGGLCTALSAVEAGARVLILEKGDEPGGSMRMSGGTIWTSPSMAVADRWAPEGNRARKQLLVDGIRPGIAWLQAHGVRPLATFDTDLRVPRQVGMEVDVEELPRQLAHAIEARGGSLAVRAALDRLVRDDSGGVIGVIVRTPEGRRTITARAVVLATGGFQGNRALLAQWVSRDADSMLLRSNPRSVGDGLLAALEVGARTSASMSTFYGHTMPALPADVPAPHWTDVTAYYSQDTVLVNVRGERFFDESSSMADERAPAQIAQQPGGRAFLVLDDRVYRQQGGAEQSPSEVRPNFDNAAAWGGPSAVAESLDELATALAAWGVSRQGFLATITAFNGAVGLHRGADLPIARRDNQLAVVQPPFRALAVRAGITFTMGGIDVDATFRVLDRDGVPIPGLYAVGADAGGTYQGGYMGGLVLGLVHGRLTGTTVARYAAAAVG